MKLFGRNPTFFIFLALLIYNSVESGRFSNPRQWLITTLLLLPAIVIGITFHEFAHAFSAWKLGDQTPKAQKRVTLNPLAHIDPIGIVILVFAGFGWGRPVQVNPLAFRKNRRLANLIVDVAGVATNFVIAILCTGLLFLLVRNPILFSIVLNIVYINVVLMVFNLLPIPPLDGFGIITEIFDLRRFSWHHSFYDYGFIILMVLVLFNVVGTILRPAMYAILGFIGNIWGVNLLAIITGG